jgi:alpha-L-arabinofuranosidase
MGKRAIQQRLLAHYSFRDVNNIGKDISGNGNDAIAKGEMKPFVEEVEDKYAVTLHGGQNGTSYLELPQDLLKNVSDNTGITVTTWIYLRKGENVWERIFDFGKGPTGPYIFLTRNFRGVCYTETDLVADAGKTFASGEWVHVAMSVTGTETGTLSSAGPVIYVNGEIVADGSISQTSSGTYKQLRQWFDTFKTESNYCNNYIGRSQHAADLDLYGSLTDFRIYEQGLTQDEVIEVMCESLTDQEIVALAKDKYLQSPITVISRDIELPSQLMGNKVSINWKSSNADVITDHGVVGDVSRVYGVNLIAYLQKGDAKTEQTFPVTVLPQGMPSHHITVDGTKEIASVSDVMYGLFYEDINNAADGGIYAELVQNRSFESFAFDTYSHASGACGCSTGRNHVPLHAWYGDVDKVIVQNEGGLNDFFRVADQEVNSHYITMPSGVTIINKGFNDSNHYCAMAIKENELYECTIWAKANEQSTLTLQLQDENNLPISNAITVEVDGNNTWSKYGVETKLTFKGTKTTFGQLALTSDGEVSIDFVSLMPQDVWGAKEEEHSETANKNYLANPNYRLRKDLVNALVELHPKFLRFPGGCISEGSYIWENVYEWKDSVGRVELRKENFNVWGYMMTMGLGYMEYFQLAEDLHAVPLPVMACGVLCQARSNYVHPAGGELRDYYVKSFTDLIDFAISTDFEQNEWAQVRKEMGHEQPFDLHYLGVGNENWGIEFFANFEYFKMKIDQYMEENYPGYELHIISTVGAQADDDAYQEGWKFLSGNFSGNHQVTFTDGKKEFEEEMTWYTHQPNYMDTIADEHYYRSNEYLLQNVDRYNYYYRNYNEDGSLNEKESSKVFVGEFASTDKNTLAGAVAEAAIMTGFENNADVVKLVAYAPLFNKVLTDGTYRWTPDMIWFDNESVWYTPNYYVQQLFAKYVGKTVWDTTFSSYKKGELTKYKPHGGVSIATGDAEVLVKSIKIINNHNNELLFEQDFTTELHEDWQVIPGSVGTEYIEGKGLRFHKQANGRNGLYLWKNEWSNYTVEVEATKLSGDEGLYIGVGLTDISEEKKNVIEYAIHYNGTATGVKVFKDGVEGYTLGDYSSSTAAGNLRTSMLEKFQVDTPYTITVNYGGITNDRLVCSYKTKDFESKRLDYKLEAYNRDIFHTVSTDDDKVYMKLVNADGYEKVTKISLKGLQVKNEAHCITITGDESVVDLPNVNKKGNEQIVPVESQISIDEDTMLVTLEPYSVKAIVMDKR